MNKYSLRRSAAYALASVIHKVSPKSHLIRAEATDLGFECEFAACKALRDLPLDALEELLREISSLNTKIVVKEMLADNAASYFRSKGFSEAALDSLEYPGQVVDVVEIGEYLALGFGSLVQLTSELRCVKLLSKEDGETITIKGVAAPNAKELKSFLKNFSKREEWDSTFFLKKLGWILEQQSGQYLLREPLVEVKNKLYALLQEKYSLLEVEPLSVLDYPLTVCPGKGFYSYCAKVSQESRECQFDGIKNQLYCEQNLLLSPFDEEKLISHLQFISNWIKILPLQGNWILCRQGKVSKRLKSSWEHYESCLRKAAEKCRIPLSPEVASDEEAQDFLGPRIDFVVRDRLGREWKTAHSGLLLPEKDPVESRGQECVIQTSPFGGVERFIALLLEECRRDGKAQEGQLAGSTQEKRFNALEQILPPGFVYRKSN